MRKLHLLKLQFILILVPIALCMSFCWIVDPYFIWHKSSLWFHSPALDTQLRYIKPLQAILKKPDVIILGSSRVYRGFNAKELIQYGFENPYNFGIPSLKIDEMLSILKWHLLFNKPKLVILGLDFWMFSESENSELLNNKYKYQLINELFASLISTTSIINSYNALKTNKVSEDGQWQKDGSYISHKKNKQIADLMLISYKNYLKEIKYNDLLIKNLSDIIQLLKNSDIELVVYISPMHLKTLQIYKQVGLDNLFNSWCVLVAKICEINEIFFLNYSEKMLINTNIYNNDDDWLDYSHFGPLIGAKMLKEMFYNIKIAKKY